MKMLILTSEQTLRKEVTLANPEVTVGASATAVVSTAGTITSISITSGGVGYSTIPDVSVGTGTTTATATATISGGVVTGVTITNEGSGYTQSNPPLVLIGPPAKQTEINEVPPTGYSGDSGIVVGFGTTVIGVAKSSNDIDLHIPYDSAMRDTTLVGTAVTLSGMSTGDYFIVRNSNVGSATTSTSLGTDNSTVVGVGNSFIDSVYVVKSTELHTRSIVGCKHNYFESILKCYKCSSQEYLE